MQAIRQSEVVCSGPPKSGKLRVLVCRSGLGQLQMCCICAGLHTCQMCCMSDHIYIYTIYGLSTPHTAGKTHQAGIDTGRVRLITSVNSLGNIFMITHPCPKEHQPTLAASPVTRGPSRRRRPSPLGPGSRRRCPRARQTAPWRAADVGSSGPAVR